MLIQFPIPILGFAAASGTGKTTLLTQVIPLLTAQQIRVGLIKHSHHAFEIDQPGKDSYRLHHAGASSTLLVSPFRRALISEIAIPQEPSLFAQLQYLVQEQLDLILVEGFKHENICKIELHRSELHQPLLYLEDSNIIAVASNVALALPVNLTLLDINQPKQCAEFILHWAHLTA